MAQHESGSASAGQPLAADRAANLLEQVLDQSTHEYARILELDTSRAALERIARRYPGTALTLQPVLTEWVTAILADFWRPAAPRETVLWPLMGARIAAVIYSDERARARIEKLWRAAQGTETP